YGADPNSLGPGEWRTGDVKKVIIIMADAEPHDPEPYSGYTLNDVVGAANGKSINIFSILTGFGVGRAITEQYFGDLAEDTGGAMFGAADATQVVEAFMDAIELITMPPTPIYVDETCTLTGWEPNDANNPWDVDDPNGPWSADSNNIVEDPNFIYGYYLSQFATGHTIESNCVDGGSGDANDPNIGMYTYTTRIDGKGDANRVDMGYHYPEGVPRYELTVIVLDANGQPADPNSALGYVDPNHGWYYQGAEVTVTPTAYDSNYHLREWYDVNDEFISGSRLLRVVMDSNQVIFARFGLGHTTLVSGVDGPDALRNAVEAARNGDTLIVEKDYVYNGDINLQGKEIAIVSSMPDNPDIVAATVIDCGGGGRAFTFNSGEDAGTIIHGFTIINGSLTGQPGGAIYIGSGTSPTLAHLVIRDCTVIGAHGGGIFIDSNSEPNLCYITISNCSVTNADGGGIYISDGSYPTFYKCTIADCGASDGDGGGVYCGTGNSVEFMDCRFRNNTATYDGGGLYYGSEGMATLTGCAFSGNRAESGAGIYYDANCVWALTDCSFTDNEATEDGGGVLSGLNNSMMITDCNFTNNLAWKGAGLHFDPNCGGTISGSTLVDNDANENGGAAYIDGCNDIEVNDCNISYNTAHHGGGLFCLWSPGSRIINCSIKYNHAARVTIDTLYFEPDPNNPGQPLDPDNPVDETDPNFDPNDPNWITIEQRRYAGLAQGGGIYSFAGPKLIADCDISYNTSRTSGGGLYLAGDDDPASSVGPHVKNCLITNNRAGTDGAGLSCHWIAEAKISNCTIADNELTQIPAYGGGLSVSYESDVEVIDSIIWGNVGDTGSQIAVGSGADCHPWPSNVTITHCDIQVAQEDPNAAGFVVPTEPVGPIDPCAP
ncbi:MAG: right-handed parallel beta-helix repeat-containing protein, partial [Planctomycetota bacterium]